MAERSLTEVMNRLVAARIVPLLTPIDQLAAEQALQQMELLKARDPEAEINVYLQSPGGAVDASVMIAEAMRQFPAPVSTLAVGDCSGTAVLLLALGDRGKRFARPESRLRLVPVSVTADHRDLVVQARLERARALLTKMLAQCIGCSPERAELLMEADLEYSAEEAKFAGLIDAALGR